MYHYCERNVEFIKKTRIEEIPHSLLCDVKEHLRVTFDSDDNYIMNAIKTVVEVLELSTNRAFTRCTINAILSGGGEGELPFYSESIENLVVKRMNDEVVTPKLAYESLLELPCHHNKYKVSYNTGFSTLPAEYISAIQMMVAFMYNHRGDDLQAQKDITQLVPTFINHFRRVSWAVV